ncbi:hypothetical protein L6452_31777 [Arctium lappa]|uniref:Uncharacterized protein n=1 Tax=Arctium lappa TaxID=4217 RepID=A0ACB8Z342_ARCLA|nr:hypothetical protein L6452_31777 [Arctium lappa]
MLEVERSQDCNNDVESPSAESENFQNRRLAWKYEPRANDNSKKVELIQNGDLENMGVSQTDVVVELLQNGLGCGPKNTMGYKECECRKRKNQEGVYTVSIKGKIRQAGEKLMAGVERAL